MNANTIHHDNATTWRDLADQLTLEQVERLEELEHDPDTLVRLTGKTDLRWTADALLSSAPVCGRQPGRRAVR